MQITGFFLNKEENEIVVEKWLQNLDDYIIPQQKSE